MQLCHQIIHCDLGRPYYKITVTEKIKTINNKVEQKKAQYDLDGQTARKRLARKSCYNKKV